MLTEDYWKAIIAHELGHAVDFHIFGPLYRLKSKPVNYKSAAVENSVAQVNTESDPEIRADKFADVLLLGEQNEQICYDPILKIQHIEPDSRVCNGLPLNESSIPMKHFPHTPLQGRRVL